MVLPSGVSAGSVAWVTARTMPFSLATRPGMVSRCGG